MICSVPPYQGAEGTELLLTCSWRKQKVEKNVIGKVKIKTKRASKYTKLKRVLQLPFS